MTTLADPDEPWQQAKVWVEQKAKDYWPLAACVLVVAFCCWMVVVAGGKSDEPGSAGYWAAIEIAASIAAVVVPIGYGARSDRALARFRRNQHKLQRGAAADAVKLHFEVMRPLLMKVGEVAAAGNKKDRDALAAAAVTAALNTAVTLAESADHPRCSWYQLTTKGGSRALVCEGSDFAGGRGVGPKREFVEGSDQRDDSVLSVVDNKTSEICLDTKVNPPKDFDRRRPRDYQTFMITSVFAGSRVYGALMLDASTKGTLTDEHLRVLRAVANVLGSALSYAERSTGTRPTTQTPGYGDNDV